MMTPLAKDRDSVGLKVLGIFLGKVKISYWEKSNRLNKKAFSDWKMLKVIID